MNEWCSKTRVEVECFFSKEKSIKLPKFIRCPECNRRLKPHFYDCEDFWSQSPHSKPKGAECLHMCLPPHKLSKAKRIKLRKKK